MIPVPSPKKFSVNKNEMHKTLYRFNKFSSNDIFD